LGRFQIRRELGRGNFGIVYLAYDPRLNREVALKVPRVNALADPQLRERFQREARSAAALDHPNVVPVYEAGEVGPVCYIASAYCPGITLANWLRERDRPVAFRTAAALVAQVADGVDHAHRQGVVHRDLKPGNILLVSSGGVIGKDNSGGHQVATHESPLTTDQPKITDFGLAKFFLSEEETSQTRTGALVGTPSYMAPEQAEGRRKEIGPAADVYALGVILYELLTGRPPFQAESVLETLLLVRKEEPMPPSRLLPKLPRDLETICLKCLEKEPHKRYTRAGDLELDLRRFLAGEPIRARPVPSWERALKWGRRRPAAAALIAVSTLGSLLVVSGLVVGIVLIANALRGKETALAREKKALQDIEQTSYSNGISSAEHEFFDANWGRGKESLEQCPRKLRGWEWDYLNRLRQTPQVVLPVGEHVTGSGGGIELAFHPSGRLLAIPSSENSIKVWDACTNRERPLLILRGHKKRALSVAFSPDGRRLASTSEDQTVCLWDIPDLEELGLSSTAGRVLTPLRRLQDHKERVIGVAFSPDGHCIASASGEADKVGKVKVWDAASGKLLFTFDGQAVPNSVVHLEFSPNGLWLAAGSEENTVKVWDVTTGQPVFSLSGHDEPILNVTFTPDGHRLISAARDLRVMVWDLPPTPEGALATGGRQLAPRWTLPDFSASPWCVALSADGTRLAIGGPLTDGNVRVYDMATGELLQKLPGMGAERIVGVAFSPDGRRLASAGMGRILRLWDTTTGKEALTLRGHLEPVRRVLFSPDGQRLASVSADGTVRVWDAAPFDEDADRRIRTFRDNSEFFGVAFSPDSRCLASASADRLIKLWNTETGQVVRNFQGHESPVLCVAFNDRGLLLSGSMDRTAKLWDAGTGELIRTFPGFKLMVSSVAFRPDGRAFATGSMQSLQLWEAETGRQLFLPVTADPEYVSCVAFSADAKYLATAGHTRTAKIWDANSGKEVCSFQEHQTMVSCVAFHPEGKYLASAGADKDVMLWDRATGQKIRNLSGHTDNIRGVAFSPDGRYLATASWREIMVWDTTSFDKRPKIFGRLAGRITCIAFSPDGKHLAAAGGYKGKGEIKIWESSLWEQAGVTSP
jgi:WD40 repeat protein/serine/threonine protein kinase